MSKLVKNWKCVKSFKTELDLIFFVVVSSDNLIFKGTTMPPKNKECQDKGKPSQKGIGGPTSYQEKAENDPK